MICGTSASRFGARSVIAYNPSLNSSHDSTIGIMPPAAILAPTAPAPTRPIIGARTVSRGVVLAGILLVALNLRAAITGLGALLPEVSQGLHLSGTVAGLITTLPALSFAAFGAFTPHLTRRFSSTQILLGSMAVLTIGQGARV